MPLYLAVVYYSWLASKKLEVPPRGAPGKSKKYLLKPFLTHFQKQIRFDFNDDFFINDVFT